MFLWYLWYLGVAVIGVSARLVSVADLHGDFDHAVNILVSAKLIDKVEHVGGRSQMDVDGGWPKGSGLESRKSFSLRGGYGV